MMASEENAEINTGKKVAYFAAILAAMTSTSIELDKSKLTLSAAGIGLLVAFLATIGSTTYANFVLYCFAILSFLVTIGCVLYIFQRNATYLRRILKEGATSDRVLKKLDVFSSFSFFVAVLFSMAIGLSQGLASISTEQEKCMSEKKENAVQGETFKKSLEGLGDLAPKDGDGDSTSDPAEQTTETSPSEADSKDE